jgi:Tn3 transposase DDE domain
VELDRHTGFLDAFTHAGGKQARSAQLKRNLLAVLIGLATNLGLTRMAEACGISYDTLARTAEWYVREETLQAANAALVDYHYHLPLAAAFGSGTLSSSDGQRFPTRGKSTRRPGPFPPGRGLSRSRSRPRAATASAIHASSCAASAARWSICSRKWRHIRA